MYRPAAVAFAALLALCAPAAPAAAQSATTARLLLLQADARRAPTNADLSFMRVSARSASADTARIAIRMLGRLERPTLIADLVLGLRHSLPEVRIEAANAVAQAAQGLRTATPAPGVNPATLLTSAQSALITRLEIEADSNVRGALCEALSRLPYRNATDAARAESALVALSTRASGLADRLGMARALETYARLHASLRAPGSAAVALMRQLARADSVPPGLDLSRDARVRRLAVEGLLRLDALDADDIVRASEDADAQVRRLAMRMIAASGRATQKIRDGLVDISPLVRIEALRAARERGEDPACAAAIKATGDEDMNVALVAVDQLGGCTGSAEAIAVAGRIAGETPELGVVRGWHRQAHAIVALSTLAPEQARTLLPAYKTAAIWQVRAYAGRAAQQLGDKSLLEALAGDVEDRVANVALAALGQPLRRRGAARPSELPSANAAEVRRLAAPRARIVVRDVGAIEIALFTTEAPGTVLRFVRLADEGYYNGVSFDRISPNAIVQSGARGTETAEFPARETGTWPHVRGSIGVSTTESNEAQFFVNLVDNPRFDHQLTVFAQVLNGADVVDRLLEGDVIESITIVP